MAHRECPIDCHKFCFILFQETLRKCFISESASIIALVDTIFREERQRLFKICESIHITLLLNCIMSFEQIHASYNLIPRMSTKILPNVLITFPREPLQTYQLKYYHLFTSY